MRRLCLIFLVLLIPQSVIAGAWPREQGAVFLSFSTLLTTPKGDVGADLESTPSIYLERGMRRDLTFGLDARMNFQGDYSALVFLRRPIGIKKQGHRLALLVGLGADLNGSDLDPLLRLGAAWGKGVSTGLGNGWASIDATLDYQSAQNDVAIKTDFTFGLKPNDRNKFIFQLQAGDYPGSDPYLRFAPSYVRQIGEGRHIELEAQMGLIGDDRLGLKLGTWLEF